MRTLFALAGCAALAASCAPVTPDARISANLSRYEPLPAAHKRLVREGRIDKGMSPDAVFLAWGRADREYEGGTDGRPTLRWDYFGSQPVYTGGGWSGYYDYGYGPGWGRYGRYPAYGYGFSVGPQIDYIPYRRATVEFRNNRVVSWERAR